ncbi:putative phospholipase A2, group VI [Operophtera brumata]|uniref:phospholipase A2 n=1 Tax=Operophtera brumata TaxID=104452 RepID=A0A0L7LDY7_OPEBR|nr:putative phospholipase A2, group VI [Operophtera brumata]
MMQHQYWVTKKTVLKKLGTKEDACIVASDAELDAKLELFRSISDSCLQLHRVLDQYQERLCILAQEENSLGKFLRDSGKNADASGKHMVSAGKAISYSGQQRLSVRGPLLRLYHEVETFRGRAVSDMRATVSAMEKSRIEYRAALSWMKSTSAQLDPDTGRGLDNFRKAQRQVRESKKIFDKLTLDVLQKIDLLAAARCNMFSHVLSNYQNSFLNFVTKVSQTLEATADTMKSTPLYEFSILKELSQSLGEGKEGEVTELGEPKEVTPQDKDQMLFFQPSIDQNEPSTSVNLIDGLEETSDAGDVNTSLLGPIPPSKNPEPPHQKPIPKKEDKAAWFKLFAELDPLANPDSLLGTNDQILQNFRLFEDPPTKVLEVRSDGYVSRPIQYREESILLYGPKLPADGKNNNKEKCFEIVLHKPFTESLHQMYSLFRAPNLDIGEEKFIVYKERIPIFIKITKECTVASLQKLCDTLTEHPSWTIAHLVAHFGLFELFNHEDVQKHMDEVDPASGTTPLMSRTAAHFGLFELFNHEDVQKHINEVDPASGTTPLMALASKSVTTLNVYNKQGYTPLHTACLADAPDCVRALMLAGADVNLTAAKRTGSQPGIVGELLKDNQTKLYQQDMKYGGTPIHWAISREVIEALADKNCDINALNFDGRTALHVMVLRERLECAIALLSRGAEHSIADKDGNTPLHIAVKQTNVTIVQALVVFGADLEAKDKNGYTARHCVPSEMSNSNYDKILYIIHAVGAKRCPSEWSSCPPSCSARGDYNGVPPPAVAKLPTREIVNQMLAVAAMEQAANMEAKEKLGRLLCLDGGGIRGLVLVQTLLSIEEAIGRPVVQCFDWIAGTSTAAGKSLRECQRLYFRMKEYAFVGMRPYPSEPYLDGGLMGNNPTLDALTELAELRLAYKATGQVEAAAKTNLRVVVSCGTGNNPVTRVKDFDVFKPESLWDAARLAWGVSAIGNLLVDQATQADGRVTERARAWCASQGVPYYRFSPHLSRDIAMDDRDDARLVTMLWETQAHTRQHRDQLAELAALLL